MIDPGFLIDWVSAILNEYDQAITDPTECGSSVEYVRMYDGLKAKGDE